MVQNGVSFGFLKKKISEVYILLYIHKYIRAEF